MQQCYSTIVRSSGSVGELDIGVEKEVEDLFNSFLWAQLKPPVTIYINNTKVFMIASKQTVAIIKVWSIKVVFAVH